MHTCIIYTYILSPHDLPFQCHLYNLRAQINCMSHRVSVGYNVPEENNPWGNNIKKPLRTKRAKLGDEAKDSPSVFVLSRFISMYLLHWFTMNRLVSLSNALAYLRMSQIELTYGLVTAYLACPTYCGMPAPPDQGGLQAHFHDFHLEHQYQRCYTRQSGVKHVHCQYTRTSKSKT